MHVYASMYVCIHVRMCVSMQRLQQESNRPPGNITMVSVGVANIDLSPHIKCIVEMLCRNKFG